MNAQVSRTLSEIDAVCRKAARGAGRPWGMAEEAGRAVRWLEARGLPGCVALAVLLTDPALAPPILDGQTWRAAGGGALCPLTLGTAVSDRRALGWGAQAQDVAWPLLFAPFLERVGPWGDHNPPVADMVVFAESSPPLSPTSFGARSVDAAAWRTLGALAHKTYVSASAESRLSGAGAGLTDND